MPSTAQRRRAGESIRQLCQSRFDPLTLRQELVPLLRRAVPFDGCCLVATDPAMGAGGTSFLFENVATGNVPRVIHNELEEEDFNKFDLLGRSFWPVGVLSEATGGVLERSPRYRALLAPQNVTDELRAATVVGSVRWGSLTLVRRGGHFDDEDAAAVAAVSSDVGRALRRGLLSAATSGEPDDRAGLILVDNCDRVVSATPAGRFWLEELAEESALPGVVQQALVRARLLADATPRLRAITRSGRWVAVHGAPLAGDGIDPQTIAVVVETARPDEVAPLVLEAYGLSGPEQRIAKHVLAGRSTKEIAHSLHLSPYTVQDHLKSIFTKTGTRTRGELVARLFLGST
jgi:DNA-binding CsgD family transcriptional regulator